MTSDWRAPGIGRVLITLFVLPLFAALPITVLLGYPFTAYVISMVIWYAIVGAVFLLVRDEMRGVRGAAWRRVDVAPLEARRAIEAALTAAGWAFEVRTPSDGRDIVTTDVEGGLFITMVPSTDHCVAYVGQAKDGTKGGREGLQRLVDSAVRRT